MNQEGGFEIINADSRVQEMVLSCFNRMDNAAINDISQGYDGDVEQLVHEVVQECHNILYGGRRTATQTVFDAIDSVNNSLEESYRVNNFLYWVDAVYGKEVTINWHHIEWSRLVESYNYLAILAARDHGKSFFFNKLFSLWKMYGYDKDIPSTHMNRVGFIFSNNDTKAEYFLSLIQEDIKFNDILRDRFMGKDMVMNAGHILTQTGAVVDVKGFLGSARGYHPQWIVVDDPLTDQTLYSPTYREKCIDYFKSVVIPMLVPDGQLVMVGTPFHSKDIYHIFREDPMLLKMFAYREYPAIFPDGSILWSDRYNYNKLKEQRLIQGGQIFGREYLLKPVTSDTSMFPWKMIQPAIEGMDDYVLVPNIEAFPIKFERVGVGCDFAKSANVGSDATWFGVWGEDAMGDRWLIYSWRKIGAKFGEQIAQLKTINTNFRPEVMVLEANNFQKIYVEHLENTGLPVVSHVTGGKSNKKGDIADGVPSMAVQFERRKIHLPYGDAHSKNTADLLLSEFNSVMYTDKGIQGVGGHDDGVMMTWFGQKALSYEGGGFGFEFM